MLFNSFDFLIFFPIVVLLYYLIPHKARHIWLLVASYYFYMCWNAGFALLILASTALTYASGIILGRVEQRWKKLTVAICVTINLGVLIYFKYSEFILTTITNLLNSLNILIKSPEFDILLPVGISFYTFQALGYLFDVYRGKVEAERDFLKYALFVSFFPQILSGPIGRADSLLPQIRKKHKFTLKMVRDGLMLMLWGYFLKMVLGDRVAVLVDTVFNNSEAYPGWYLIVATVLFAIQIYCDFGGYSTIAVGAAKVMGFNLTDNFESPYLSLSVAEFWRRWHVSLSSWFRDYVYIPLGGNRKGKVRKYLNLMTVFALSGLWHGAEWSFLVWGLLNGAYQVAGELLKPVRAKLAGLLGAREDTFSHKLYCGLVTFVLVDFAWMFFRADNMTHAVQIVESMIRADNIHILFDDSLFGLGLDWKNCLVMLLAFTVLLIVDILKKSGISVRKWIYEQELWFRWAVYIAAVLLILVFGLWGSGYDEKAFIYFQF